MIPIPGCCTDQLNSLKEELKQRQTEAVRLRTMLASKTKELSQLASDAYTGSGDPTLINEDGELEMAYRTQKELNT